MASHALRALVLTTWLYSLLVWIYIVLRIVLNGVDVYEPFIDRYPYISILELAFLAFGVSFLSMFIYLLVRWRPPASGSSAFIGPK